MPKLPKLAEVTSLRGSTYVYDPTKVVALFQMARIDGGGEEVALHVVGIGAMPIPIGGTADAFVANLDRTIAVQFVPFTGGNGPMKIKATAVSLLMPSDERVHDPNVKCVIYFGATQYLGALEDVPTVRAAVDGIRDAVTVQYDIDLDLF